MPVTRTARHKGTTATIIVKTYDNGSGPSTATRPRTAARLVMQCLESLANTRDQR